MMAGVKLQRIPYNGGVPALADLVADRVQMYLTPPLVAMPFIKNGRIRAIAISGERRSLALLQVPTFTEAGLPGFDVKSWFGILAPGGTQRAIATKLSSEIRRIILLPEVGEKLANQGMEPFVTTPEEFAELMKKDLVRFADIIRNANIKIEN